MFGNHVFSKTTPILPGLIEFIILMISMMYRDQTHSTGINRAHDNKQLLDEVFVICGIINVEVRVISPGRRRGR